MNQNNKYKSTKVASGKRVQPPAPKPISLTNADFLRTAQYGLYGLSNEKNFYVNSIILYNNQHPYTLNSKQIKYLTGLFRGVDKYLSQNTLIDPSNHRITKIIRRKTINLARWSKAYQSQLALQALPNNLWADFALRVMVDDIIHNHQLQRNTNKYPSYPYVIKALNNHRTGLRKIQLSARQYFNFKLWRARGSYWWYIQP